jgi:hypothetical protein
MQIRQRKWKVFEHKRTVSSLNKHYMITVIKKILKKVRVMSILMILNRNKKGKSCLKKKLAKY